MSDLRALLELSAEEEERARVTWVEAARRCDQLQEEVAALDEEVAQHDAALDAFLHRLDRERAGSFTVRDIRHHLQSRDSLQHTLDASQTARDEARLRLRKVRAEARRLEETYNQTRAALEALQEELKAQEERQRRRRQRAREDELNDLLTHARLRRDD